MRTVTALLAPQLKNQEVGNLPQALILLDYPIVAAKQKKLYGEFLILTRSTHSTQSRFQLIAPNREDGS